MNRLLAPQVALVGVAALGLALSASPPMGSQAQATRVTATITPQRHDFGKAIVGSQVKASFRVQFFRVDVEVCPRCGGEMRILAFVTEPAVITRILGHLERRGIDARAGPWARAAG